MPFLRPYVSARLLGDVRGEAGTPASVRNISPSGASSSRAGWQRNPGTALTGWFEAGEALIYHETSAERRRWMPDYRGGVAYAKGFGNLLTKGSQGKFAETNIDGIFISRFSNDSILYSQNRAGYTLRSAEGLGGFAWPSRVEREPDGRRQAAILGQLRRDRTRSTLPLRKLAVFVFSEPAARGVPVK